MASGWPNSLFEGEDDNKARVAVSGSSSRNTQNRLFRSQSITDQLNKTPRVAPHWGHSLSKSYGGPDWPLPASDSSNTAVSTPASGGTPGPGVRMYSATVANDPIWPDSSVPKVETGPKKRGPKPKNEPALTRRQQLNRIAQRAHRDRKELYIKNLESEVKRFRQAYTASLAERQRLLEENRMLREEVAAFRAMAGLPVDDVVMTQAPYSLPPPQPLQPFPGQPLITQPLPSPPQAPAEGPPKGLGRMLSKLKRKDSGGMKISPPLESLNGFDNLTIARASRVPSGAAFPPSPPHGSLSSDSPPESGHGRTLSNTTMSTLQSQGMELPLAAVALNFIVRLEAVCLDHLHAANQAEQDPESAPHGHALMGSALSCSSPSSTVGTSPLSSTTGGASSTASPGPWTMDQKTLEVLLNLNFQTNNGDFVSTMGGPIYGQISVLDAWNLVSSHPKFGKFDLDAVASRLAAQVTCRGYGPVVEAEDVFRAIDEVSSGQMYGRI